MSDWQKLVDALEAEKKATASAQAALDVKDTTIQALTKQLSALQTAIDAEASARVQLQLDVSGSTGSPLHPNSRLNEWCCCVLLCAAV